jgi:DNA polymerase-1
LSISLRDASSFIADYYAKLPGVKRWLDRAVADARERGYAETLLGRRRMLPALHSPNAGERSAAERMAVNTPIQGTAADLIKVAMVRLHTRLRADHSRARLLLQVHDELLLEAPSEDAHTVAEVLRAEMSAVMEMRVPLVVETGSGESWFDAHA